MSVHLGQGVPCFSHPARCWELGVPVCINIHIPPRGNEGASVTLHAWGAQRGTDGALKHDSPSDICSYGGENTKTLLTYESLFQNGSMSRDR